MKIKQDPITKLWCREDGAVLMPPSGRKFKRFRWTFGSKDPSIGYHKVRYGGKLHLVHRLVCRAFNGLPPEDKPFVDHINRVKDSNRPENLHWVSCKENNDNADCVDQALEKYGVRQCDDKKAYLKAYYAAHRENDKAHHATKRAKMKSQGLVMKKGPDGKQGWFPRVRPVKEESCK